MSFLLEWLIEGRIVLTEINGTLTRHEATVIAEEAFDLIQGHPGRQVHYVVDVSQLEKLDLTLADLPKGEVIPPNSLNWIVFISNPDQKISTPIKFLASVAAQQMRLRVRFFETRSAAFDFLYSMDNTLDLI